MALLNRKRRPDEVCNHRRARALVSHSAMTTALTRERRKSESFSEDLEFDSVSDVPSML